MTGPMHKHRSLRALGGWAVDVLAAVLITLTTWQLAWRTMVSVPLDIAISVVMLVAVLLLLRAIRS